MQTFAISMVSPTRLSWTNCPAATRSDVTGIGRVQRPHPGAHNGHRGAAVLRRLEHVVRPANARGIAPDWLWPSLHGS